MAQATRKSKLRDVCCEDGGRHEHLVQDECICRELWFLFPFDPHRSQLGVTGKICQWGLSLGRRRQKMSRSMAGNPGNPGWWLLDAAGGGAGDRATCVLFLSWNCVHQSINTRHGNNDHSLTGITTSDFWAESVGDVVERGTKDCWACSIAVVLGVGLNLLKLEVLYLGPRWRIWWYIGVYQRRDETGSLCRPHLNSSTRCIIPYIYGLESSSLYTCNASWRSVHYMILNKPLVRLTTAYYQSAVSMIRYNSLSECSVSSWNNISQYSISTESRGGWGCWSVLWGLFSGQSGALFFPPVCHYNKNNERFGCTKWNHMHFPKCDAAGKNLLGELTKLVGYYHRASFANFVAAATNLEIITKFKLWDFKQPVDDTG